MVSNKCQARIIIISGLYFLNLLLESICIFVPGTNLQIKSDNNLIDDKPDYLILLAWHLSEPIMNKWNKRGLRSKYIVPLPEVKII